MQNRVRNAGLRARITDAETAARLIQNRMTVAMGGYTSSGYPKVIASELVRRKQAGEDLSIFLLTASNVWPLDELLAPANVIDRRAPMCAGRALAKQINQRKVQYVEQQMNKLPGLLHSGAFGKIDIAVVEALAITEEGYLIPTSSIGMVPNILDEAEAIIVEINLAQPTQLEGLHDVYRPAPPPHRKPIPLISANQRIGEPFVRVDPGKIKYIVESRVLDSVERAAETTEAAKRIADHLFNFLELEIPKNFRGYLPPFQTGFGNLATQLVAAMKQSKFQDIQFFCGGLGEANMELMLTGKVKAASCGSIEMTPKVLDIIRNHSDVLKEVMLLRNGEVTNNAETIHRLGTIALNSAIEVDIYGNVNSSHIGGSSVVNGIGGGANFAQNAGLSIVLLPSQSKGGAISTIVPMVFHQDISEHDVDILITENGVADLRGKDEVERAGAVIQYCASEIYRDQLAHYLDRAITECGGHRPQLPVEAYDWYERLKQTGTMRRAQSSVASPP
jgi:succinyl-CoA:acetate CoA-transferase